MLQKLITSRYSPTETNRTFNFQYFHDKDKDYSHNKHNNISHTNISNPKNNYTNNKLINSSILR